MILPLVAVVALFQKPTDLTFVRHGETVANATGRYNSKTLNAFSEKGQKGVDALTTRLLAEPKFDRILVSPSPRALKTIAPYLKASHQTAIVWPLLYECCTGRRPAHAAATKFTYSGKITLPADIASLFVIKSGYDKYPNAPDYNSGLAQVDASVAEFRQLLSGGRVLLVGHSGQGGQFLHQLTDKWIKIENTRPYKFELR